MYRLCVDQLTSKIVPDRQPRCANNIPLDYLVCLKNLSKKTKITQNITFKYVHVNKYQQQLLLQYNSINFLTLLHPWSIERYSLVWCFPVKPLSEIVTVLRKDHETVCQNLRACMYVELSKFEVVHGRRFLFLTFACTGKLGFFEIKDII